MSYVHFDYSLANDGTVTLAQVAVVVNGKEFFAAEHSFRMPGDKYDGDLGDWLALGRCLETIADSMILKAERRSYVNDKKAAENSNRRTRKEWEALQARNKEDKSEKKHK